MAVKDILVSIDPTPAGETRLKLAANLAQSNAAFLTGAFAPANGNGASSDGENLQQRFEAALAEGEWHAVGRREPPQLTELAKAADLTVLGQYSAAARLRPEEVLVAAGRPVPVVPYAGNFDHVGRRVLVAWDDSPEAVRAINDALPLLEKAQAVTVMFVGPQEAHLKEAQPSLERIVRHLQRHQIEATPQASLSAEIKVSDILLSRTADHDADLIVAGGYHHSQLREALLGGVSRELLRHMTVPVLMSH
jgi:nucleotide-binding universal stress UspA family protein